ncbi:type II DNA topoisomerase [Sistotremastrum suecicum HHB10207 ss-3]|uniref:DNA topoisomerase (ATP-hydrolyzing) n=1 Tax=Sistotremastrum suecicum HHB10207 ss-3 TaxID=1314776 RepID=A0A165YZZ2_9AGAM|nr:type II DNA topoisomerase [Sistotremastrum suecicum HHB10207 ss-3]
MFNQLRTFLDLSADGITISDGICIAKTVLIEYQLDEIEHISKRPDSYVGSLEFIRQNMWLFDSGTKCMVFREITRDHTCSRILPGRSHEITHAPAFSEIFNDSPENGEGGEGGAQPKQTLIYDPKSLRLEVAWALSHVPFQQMSFAKAIAAPREARTDMKADVHFHNALITDPTSDSHTLTLPASDSGGSKPQSGTVDNVLNCAARKADEVNKRTDGSKRTRFTGVTQLSELNNAGGRNTSKCALVLTEGDSAKSLGLTVVERDDFGVFPLRGKLLNLRGARHGQIMKSEDNQAIKKILVSPSAYIPKVAQLVGYISEYSAYHHGEASLVSTLINLAHDYVGKDNINLLESRLDSLDLAAAGGKDHASARYIFRQPLPISPYIFHPADDPVLKYQEDNGNLNIACPSFLSFL